MSNRPFSVLVSGGGTGGHLIPGVALMRTLASRDPRAQITFLVPGRPVDVAILSSTPFRWYCDPMRSFPRGIDQSAEFCGRAMRSLGTALRVFRRHRPDVVVALGGYGSLTSGAIARLKGIPFVLLESNRVAGKVVRWLAPWSEAVYSNGPVSRVPQDRVKPLGIPIRSDLPFEREWEFPRDRRIHILVMGGSQGASCINEAVCQALPRLAEIRDRIRFTHLCGERQLECVARAYEANRVPAEVFPFCKEMGRLYRDADFAICRAGGSTLAEITAIGLPAILVPYAHAAHDHQSANALAMASVEAAMVIPENELDGASLAANIGRLVREPRTLSDMARRAKALGKPSASADILEDILARVRKS